MEELLVSSLAQTDALAKLLIEKGANYAGRVYAEDFQGTGDVSEAIESDAAMSISKRLIWESNSVVLADSRRDRPAEKIPVGNSCSVLPTGRRRGRDETIGFQYRRAPVWVSSNLHCVRSDELAVVVHSTDRVRKSIR